jgi:protein TonB
VLGICTAITFVSHVLVAVIYPTFEAQASDRKKQQVVIETVDIPETKQIKRPPPPPRPAVPIETESDEVPDDVTIESTDLDFDDAMVDLPPPPPPGETAAEEEEILEFFMVEDKPELIKSVPPVYPEIARKAGLTGKVFLKFLVGKDGRVSNVQVLKGQEIFRQAAIDAIMQFRFKPAKQNDKPVGVWMTQPITFRLN